MSEDGRELRPDDADAAQGGHRQEPEHEQRDGPAESRAVSPVVPVAASARAVSVRTQAHAIPSSSGAISALRMSLTTVATSSAPGE